MSKIETSPVGGDAPIVPIIQLTAYGKIVKKHLDSMRGVVTYVIMPNHIHLIIEKNGAMRASHPTRLCDDIRYFKTRCTKETGTSIWQRSFYDHIIRSETDYVNHLRYIEENPKKWMMGQDEYYA